MKSAVVVAILVSWLGMAVADIIEWQDADGVSHYTNLKGEIPKEQEGATRVIVDEVARQSADGTAPTVAEEPALRAPEPQAKTEVVNDPADVADAYVRGVLRGIESAGSAAGDRGGSIVQINGPLAVVNSTSPEPYDVSYPSLYPWLYSPGFFPGVTAAFDHGRARHRHQRPNPNSFLFAQRVVPPAGRPPLGVALDPISGQARIVPPAGLPPMGVGLNPLSVGLTGRTAAGGVSRGTRATLR